MTAYKVAAILYTSDELVEDAHDFNVVQLIIGLFSEAIAEEEDKVITQGSGVGQPTGLTNCTITNTACAGNLGSIELLSIKKLKANAINCWELLRRTISSQVCRMV